MNQNEKRPLAVVTGASTGIGYELAKICANAGFDLVVAADEPLIHAAAREFRSLGADVAPVEVDLATTTGVDRVIEAIDLRPVEVLLANAGHGLGHAFLDQDWPHARHVIDTNVTGTLYLIHEVGRRMRDRGQGRILITGSIAGLMPGAYHAVYNGTEALLGSFARALRAELADSGVTVTCLMPGPTETEFFARADMRDTRVGAARKQPADEVARVGFDAMKRGDEHVVVGWQNKLRAAMAHILPAPTLAKMHAKRAAPGGAR